MAFIIRVYCQKLNGKNCLPCYIIYFECTLTKDHEGETSVEKNNFYCVTKLIIADKTM